MVGGAGEEEFSRVPAQGRRACTGLEAAAGHHRLQAVNIQPPVSEAACHKLEHGLRVPALYAALGGGMAKKTRVIHSAGTAEQWGR